MIGDATVNRLWRALKARSLTERVLQGLNVWSLGTFLLRPPSYAVRTQKGVLRGVSRHVPNKGTLSG